MSWTPERVERLQAMWLSGCSAAEIAETLGTVTRNAVIGKVSRLGLIRDEKAVHDTRAGLRPPKKRAPQRTRPARIAQPRTPKRNDHFAAINAVSRSKSKPGVDYRKVKVAAVDASLAKPWTERQFGECAYPISGEMADTFSCCQPTDKTYCPAHAAIMFQPDQPKMSKTMRIARLAA